MNFQHNFGSGLKFEILKPNSSWLTFGISKFVSLSISHFLFLFLQHFLTLYCHIPIKAYIFTSKLCQTQHQYQLYQTQHRYQPPCMTLKAVSLPHLTSIIIFQLLWCKHSPSLGQSNILIHVSDVVC